MIIHSIVPHELIFPSSEDMFSNQMECKWNEVPILVESEGNRCRVIRIMSTNPSDYLKSEIQPGAYIEMPIL